MIRRVLLFVLALALLGWPAPLALAEGRLEIVAPPPERTLLPPDLVTPGQPPQMTRPREQDFYPDQVRSRHDPAFIVPFTTTIPTGPRTGVRVGLSGWTAPATRGETQLRREAGGVLAFGFSLAWTVELPAPGSEKPAETPR